jgi:ethanolamine utilization cobalamin adenosyltransferase
MNDILTESVLRSALLDKNTRSYHVKAGTFVTPLALEYLRDRDIELVFDSRGESMPCTPIEDRGDRTYVEIGSGKGHSQKPERMTHLYANQLVPKTHPRIVLRGKLDTMQAEIILAQAEAASDGMPQLALDLGEVLSAAREVLGAEVTGRELAPLKLFGYDSDELRRISHHVKETFGFQHPTPSCDMGALAARLNLLRAITREAELAAEFAFREGERDDIIQTMNRMSSAVYILFCSLLAGKYGR